MLGWGRKKKIHIYFSRQAAKQGKAPAAREAAALPPSFQQASVWAPLNNLGYKTQSANTIKIPSTPCKNSSWPVPNVHCTALFSCEAQYPNAVTSIYALCSTSKATPKQILLYRFHHLTSKGMLQKNHNPPPGSRESSTPAPPWISPTGFILLEQQLTETILSH